MGSAEVKHVDRATMHVIVAEDHHIVRNGLKALLEKQQGLKVVGEAAGGQEVLGLLNNNIKADVILTDINMPGMDGLELIEQVKQQHPDIKLIVLSMLDNEKFIVKAFKAGASAYLLKSVANEEMIFALKQVYNGQPYLCTEIAVKMLNRLMRLPESMPVATETNLDLSVRDIEVLNLIADGFTNDEIADKLFTSKRTIEGYRQSLLNRTECRNTAALVKFAFVNGLLNT